MTADPTALRCAGDAAVAQSARRRLVERFLQCDAAMKAASLSVIDALARGGRKRRVRIPIDEARHFPGDDVFDPVTGAQYFLHRHAAGMRPVSMHLHFFQRWRPAELSLPDDETISTHLAALELNARGEPCAWFAINQWVVGDYWRPADDTLELFSDWRIVQPEQGRGDELPMLCHQWLASYLQLNLLPEIDPLLRQRDAVLDGLVDAHPGVNVLEAREHEVLACRPVDFQGQLAGWAAELGRP